MISLENEILLEKNDMIVFRVNKNKNITYVNDSFPDLFLYEKDFIFNKNIEEEKEEIKTENNNNHKIGRFYTEENLEEEVKEKSQKMYRGHPIVEDI